MNIGWGFKYEWRQIMELYFKNYIGKLLKLSDPQNLEEACAQVREYCKRYSYRIRTFQVILSEGDENELVIDVGSHTACFVVKT